MGDMTDHTATITTAAVGETRAPPDEVGLKFSTRAVEPDVTSARREVAERSSRLRAALEDTGVPDEVIRTEQFRVSQRHPDPRFERSSERDPDELPYVAVEHVGVSLRDLDSLGQVLSAAVDDAEAEIENVIFTFRTETMRELQQEALSDAVTTARKNAEAAAAAEGLELGDVRWMSTDEGRHGQRPMSGQQLVLDSESGGAPSSGPIDVHARVEVEYELCEP